MTVSSDGPPPWRGYLNKLTYGAPLNTPVDDAQIIRIAEGLIAGQLFEDPVDVFYQAAIAGLRSEESLRWSDDQAESVVRDFLTRLVGALDQRKPWPEPAFTSLPVELWPKLQSASIVGRISEYPSKLQTRLRRHFSVHDSDSPDSQIMVLRLRTGQTVSLQTSSWLEPNVNVYSDGDPEATREAIHELIGLVVQPS